MCSFHSCIEKSVDVCRWDQKQFLYSQNGNLSVVFNETNDKTFFIVETRKMNECQADIDARIAAADQLFLH